MPREDAVMNMPNEVVIGIDADHIRMTKFVNKSDSAYSQIVLFILEKFRSKADKQSELGKLSISLDVCTLIYYSCSGK